jgi:zinc transporter ZupT
VEHVNYDTETSGETKQVNGGIYYIENAEQINNATEVPHRVEQINETTGKRMKKKQINGEINNIEDVRQVNDIIEEQGEIQQTNKTTRKPKKNKHTHNKTDETKNIEESHNHIKASESKDQKDIIAIEVPHIESASADLCETSAHHHGIALQDDGQQHKISTYLLELGIALHSVLIGLSLGTATDTFIPLFIALCFHQFFEAIALGAQIANLKTSSLRPAIIMIVFYSLTTPVGIAIGIGIHAGTYNPKAVSSLLVTGILDSLAAGILIYVALVNLINAEMGTNAHTFYSLRNRLKFLYFAALYLGVTAMAIIGRWA